MRWASEDKEALVAAVTGSGDRVGRSLVPSATRAGTDRPLRRQRSCSGAVKPRWRIWISALTRAWRAERLATTRTRMASTAPSLDLGAGGPTTEGGSGRLDSVEGIGLAARRRFWRFGRSTSMTSTPTRRR